MVKVVFNDKTKKWEELPKGSREGLYLHRKLKEKLDNGRNILKKGWDLVILIDGQERSGKSTLGMTCGYYLSDTKLSPNNFASGLEDAAHKIESIPDGSVLILDEGSLIFNSKQAMMKAQVHLMQILDVVGQKNLIFIICCPSFLDLNKTISVRRSRFLLRVYPDKNFNRGNFAYYGEKRKSAAYKMGKNFYSKAKRPTPNWRGNFMKFEPDFYKEYLKIKKKSMMEALNNAKGEKTISQKDRREVLKELAKSVCSSLPLTTRREVAKAFGVTRTTLRGYENS